MAKNRKNQAAAVRFGPLLKVVLLCSIICGSAIGYVWQKGWLPLSYASLLRAIELNGVAVTRKPRS